VLKIISNISHRSLTYTYIHTYVHTREHNIIIIIIIKFNVILTTYYNMKLLSEIWEAWLSFT